MFNPHRRDFPYIRRLVPDTRSPYFASKPVGDMIAVYIADIMSLVLVDMEYGFYKYGTGLRKESGLSQGSALTFFLGDIVAEYCFAQTKPMIDTFLTSQCILEFLLTRWVDDNFGLYAINLDTHPEKDILSVLPYAEFTSHMNQKFLAIMQKVFKDFEIKEEEPEIVVGIDLRPIQTTIHLPTKADRKFPVEFFSFKPTLSLHFLPAQISNVPKHMIRGIIKGSCMRVIDQCSSLENIVDRLKFIQKCAIYHGHKPNIFRHTLHDMAKRLKILQSVFFELF